MSDNKNSAEVYESVERFFSGEPKQEAAPETKTSVEEFFEPVVPPSIQETPQLEIEQPLAQKTDFYTNLIKEFIEDGDWDDVMVELEEGQDPIAISDLKDVTPEIFKQLKAAQKAQKEEEFNSKYVSVEGLDETARKMIELKKKGGDLSSLLQIEQQHVNPLQGLDLDNELIQEDLVRRKLTYQGIDSDIIDLKIKKLKENLTLDLESKKVVEEINLNFQATVEKQLQEQENLNKQLQEEQKTFRTSITKEYRDFGLKDSLVKNLVDASSKFDENGFADVDKAYFAAKENPKLFAEITFLVTNPEAYNEFKAVKVKNEATKNTVNKVLKISPKVATAPVQNKTTDKVEEFFQT